MRHLFTKRGEAALVAAMRRRPLLAFDFDGTLAPIVPRPEDARVPAAVSARLSWLAARVPVAIVTGRAVGDVRSRLGFAPRYVIGNHGAEDESVDAAPLTRAIDPLRDLLSAHAGSLADAGVRTEDKGLSIALHYRLAPRPVEAAALVRGLMSRLPPTLHVFAGKMVVNVIAAHAPDKADAVRRLQSRSGAAGAFYVGDDVNDEPVFIAALPQWLTVRIGRDDRASRARYFLDSVDEVAPLLDRMLAHLPTPRSRA
jgi:trehalose 6-phosphate phosphatase